VAVITWPAALKPPAEFTLSQARYDMVENSDSTGAQSARLFGPPRWRVSLRSIDAYSLRDAGVYEAMLLQLRGGINHLALHDPVRAQPQGTLRGSPTLHATAAAGATSLQLANATATNLLIGGGFEIDANANGIADSWAQYSDGTHTIAGNALVAGTGSPFAQQIGFTNLGATSADRIGYISAPGAVVAGQSYSLAYDALCSVAGMSTCCAVAWYTAGDVYINAAQPAAAALGTGYARYTVTGTAPPTAALYRVILWVEQNTLGAGSYAANFDNAHFGLAANGVAFGAYATLRAGDWLQLGTGLGTSQLVKVMADATATDDGRMTVQVEPPLRQQFASAGAVVWDRPVAYYKQLGTPQWSYRPGLLAKQGGFALDLLEAFA
jgi:hypothetical protein